MWKLFLYLITFFIFSSCSSKKRPILGESAYQVALNTVFKDASISPLKKNDLKTLGTLMYQTHEGLRTLYEVSCRELDFLVDFSKNIVEVLGARVMGGGFGGCTINLVHEDAADAFIKSVSEAYEKEFNIKLTSFEGHPSAGTTLL